MNGKGQEIPKDMTGTGPMGRCGFYCGCCPGYVNQECEGCIPAHKGGECYSRDCVEHKGVGFCPQCTEFPCEALFQEPHATTLDKDWLVWWKKRREQKG